MRDQKPSGSLCASARSFSNSASDLIWAVWEKDGGGGRPDFSCCSDFLSD